MLEVLLDRRLLQPARNEPCRLRGLGDRCTEAQYELGAKDSVVRGNADGVEGATVSGRVDPFVPDQAEMRWSSWAVNSFFPGFIQAQSLPEGCEKRLWARNKRDLEALH